MFGLLKRRRRRRLAKLPLPEEWEAILRQRLWQREVLERDERARLGGHVQVFLAEKSFEGCGGLVITDEIRVTIAANACLLLLNRPGDYFPTLRTILVYPSAYVADRPDHQEDGTVIDGPQVMLGESWDEGQIVLAWDEILADIEQAGEGHNVILHEFAHQLDAEEGGVNGAPPHATRAEAEEWRRLLSAEFERLREDVRRRRETLLDPYGAEEPAEFFAVVTETFFKLPIELRTEHPALYEQFKAYFQQDPAARVERWERRAT